MIPTGPTRIFCRYAEAGPPLLLLHGFPQTHAMWHAVAHQLADQFTLVIPDLRGYGRSGTPDTDPRHEPYSKRTMALDMVRLMDSLGFRKFAVAGHDRGGRVGYRLALDFPDRVTALSLMDIIPTIDALDRADKEFALGFWSWSLLSQEHPFPETLIAGAPDAFVHFPLSSWSSPGTRFADAAVQDYCAQFKDPRRAHAICEEYRAAASIDLEHDAEDRGKRTIACKVQVLWGGQGAVNEWYDPIEIWKGWANDVTGCSLDCGHFLPEEDPFQVVTALRSLLQ